MAVKTYDPSEVSIIVAGISVEGYADGTFLTIARDNDSFTDGSGADGEIWRAKTNDNRGTCTITLLQTSKSNDKLSALAILDEASGLGVGPLLVKDSNGRSLHAARNCWLTKPAEAEYAREVTNREWIFRVESLRVFLGGQ